MQKLILCLIGVFLTSACAQTTVKPVKYNNFDKEGLRVYDPLPLLIITCTNVQLVSVPDFTRGYTVTFKSFLAKNNSSAKVTEGLITELSANLDDTGLLSLLQSWGEKALGVAKDLAQLGAQVPGTIAGMEGIWRLNFDAANGQFMNMTRIQSGGPCPPVT
jgi:hypothetical protein